MLTIISLDKQYSYKSFYRFLTDYPSPSDTIINIWKLKVPPRILFFAWLMLKNKILTIDNLKRRGFQIKMSDCTWDLLKDDGRIYVLNISS
jgi:zinc-binding in reverse transcriptase